MIISRIFNKNGKFFIFSEFLAIFDRFLPKISHFNKNQMIFSPPSLSTLFVGKHNSFFNFEFCELANVKNCSQKLLKSNFIIFFHVIKSLKRSQIRIPETIFSRIFTRFPSTFLRIKGRFFHFLLPYS